MPYKLLVQAQAVGANNALELPFRHLPENHVRHIPQCPVPSTNAYANTKLEFKGLSSSITRMSTQLLVSSWHNG